MADMDKFYDDLIIINLYTQYGPITNGGVTVCIAQNLLCVQSMLCCYSFVHCTIMLHNKWGAILLDYMKENS